MTLKTRLEKALPYMLGFLLIAVLWGLVQATRALATISEDLGATRRDLEQFEMAISGLESRTKEAERAIADSFGAKVFEVSEKVDGSSARLGRGLVQVQSTLRDELASMRERIDKFGFYGELESRSASPSSPSPADTGSESAMGAEALRALADRPMRASFEEGLRLFGEGDYAKAQSMFENVARLDESNTRARVYAIAAAYHATPQDAELRRSAKIYLDGYLRDQGPDALVLRTMIGVCLDEGDWIKATEYYERLGILGALSAEELENAALTARYAGRFGVSAGFLDQLVAQSPPDADMLFQCGQAYTADGKIALAIARFESCLSVDPEHAAARLALAEIADDDARKSSEGMLP